MKKSWWMIVSWLLLVVFMASCSQSEDEDETGDDDDDGTVDLTLSVSGQNLDLSFGLVETEEWEGMQVVPLAALVDAALSQNADLPAREELEFDFEASDGFHSSDVGCEPLTGEALSDGYIEINSKNLMWNPDAELRGCYSVDGLSKILAEPLGTYVPDEGDDDDDDDDVTDEPAPDNVTGVDLTIVIGDQEETINLGPLAEWKTGDVIWAEIIHVVRSVSMDLPSMQTATFEAEASDGFKPSDSGCEPLGYDDFSLGRINVENGNVFWPADAGIRKCYEVNDVAKIHVYAE